MTELNEAFIQRLKFVQEKYVKPGNAVVFDFDNIIKAIENPRAGAGNHASALVNGTCQATEKIVETSFRKGADLLIQYDPNCEDYIYDLIFLRSLE